MEVYLYQQGAQLGPFSKAEIEAMLMAGEVTDRDLVWWEGLPDWTPLGQTSWPADSMETTAPQPDFAPAAPMPARRTSGLAIGALVAGIFSYLVGLLFIAAIILGHKGLAELRRNPELKGRGMALTGLILGYSVPIVLGLITIVVLYSVHAQVRRTFAEINAQLRKAEETSGTNAANNNDAATSPQLSPAAAADPQIRHIFDEINAQIAKARAAPPAANVPVTNSMPTGTTNAVPASGP